MSNNKKSRKVIREIAIKCDDSNKTFHMKNSIHIQLSGKSDYINDNIILNCDPHENTVTISIFEECKEMPRIVIYP